MKFPLSARCCAGCNPTMKKIKHHLLLLSRPYILPQIQGVPSTCQAHPGLPPNTSPVPPAPTAVATKGLPSPLMIIFPSDEDRWRDLEGNTAPPHPGTHGSGMGRGPELILTPAASPGLQALRLAPWRLFLPPLHAAGSSHSTS